MKKNVLVLLLFSLVFGTEFSQKWEQKHTLILRENHLCDFPLSNGTIGRLLRSDNTQQQSTEGYLLQIFDTSRTVIALHTLFESYENPSIDSIIFQPEGGILCLISHGERHRRHFSAVGIWGNGTETPVERTEDTYRIEQSGVHALTFSTGTPLWSYVYSEVDTTFPVSFTPNPEGGGLLVSHRMNSMLSPMYKFPRRPFDTTALKYGVEMVLSRLSQRGEILWEKSYPFSQSMQCVSAVFHNNGWHLSAVTEPALQTETHLFDAHLLRINDDGSIGRTDSIAALGYVNSIELRSAPSEGILLDSLSSGFMGTAPSRNSYLYSADHTQLLSFPKGEASSSWPQQEVMWYKPHFKTGAGYFLQTKDNSFAYMSDDGRLTRSPIFGHKPTTSLDITKALSMDDTLFALIAGGERLYMETYDTTGVLKMQKSWRHISLKNLTGAAQKGQLFLAGMHNDSLWIGSVSGGGDFLWEKKDGSVTGASIRVISAEPTEEGWLLLCADTSDQTESKGILLQMNQSGAIVSRQEEGYSEIPSFTKTEQGYVVLFPLKEETTALHINNRGETISRSEISMAVRSLAQYSDGYSAVLISGEQCLLHKDFTYREGSIKEAREWSDLPMSSVRRTYAIGDTLFHIGRSMKYVEKIGWSVRHFLVQVNPDGVYRIVPTPSIGGYSNALQFLSLTNGQFLLMAQGKNYYQDGFGSSGKPTFSSGPLETLLSLWRSDESVSIGRTISPSEVPLQRYERGTLAFQEPGRVDVYTLSGRVVMQADLQGRGAKVSLTPLSAGIYISRFRSVRGVVHQVRFVVK